MKQNLYKVILLCLLLVITVKTRSQEPDIFTDPSLKLEEIGQLKNVSSREIKDSRLSIGFECLDRFIFDPEKTYDKLAATGLKWARCQTGWNRCETEKGKYDFKWLDDVVDNLLKRDIQPWFNVGYGNKLYMPEAIGEAAVGWVPLYFGDETQKAWGNFLQALTKHFKGRVDYYEIWNEANIATFWQPAKPDPGEYLKLISFSSGIIKSTDTSVKVGACVSGSISPFVVKLFQSGVSNYIDFFSIHPYKIIPEKNYENEIRSLKLLFRNNGGENIKLWQGEAGYASYLPKGSNFYGAWHTGNENQHAKWLLRRFYLDISLGMELTSYFQIVDMTARTYETSRGKQVPPMHGLLKGQTYEPKIAYYAACNFAAIFDADTKPCYIYSAISFDRRISNLERVSRLIETAVISTGFLRNDYPVYVYYLPEDVQMEYPGMTGIDFVILKDAPKQIENPILIDLIGGRVFSITETSQDNSRFQNLPLTDYPLVITDLEALRDRIELKN